MFLSRRHLDHLTRGGWPSGCTLRHVVAALRWHQSCRIAHKLVTLKCAGEKHHDGGATNLTLSLDEIQESTVVANGYSGSYGQFRVLGRTIVSHSVVAKF